MRLRAADVAFRAAQRGYTAEEIRPCFVQDLGGGWFEVDVDHPAYPRVARDGVQVPPSLQDAAAAMLAELGLADALPSPCLCGSELHALLRDWLGIEPTPDCPCRSMAAKMDRLGPEWCESDEGMAEILGVMRAEHAKRREQGTTILPWTDYGARQLVLLACRRAKARAG